MAYVLGAERSATGASHLREMNLPGRGRREFERPRRPICLRSVPLLQKAGTVRLQSCRCRFSCKLAVSEKAHTSCSYRRLRVASPSADDIQVAGVTPFPSLVLLMDKAGFIRPLCSKRTKGGRERLNWIARHVQLAILRSVPLPMTSQVSQVSLREAAGALP